MLYGTVPLKIMVTNQYDSFYNPSLRADSWMSQMKEGLHFSEGPTVCK